MAKNIKICFKNLLVLLTIFMFSLGGALSAFAQDITVFGYTPSFVQTTPLNQKLDWNLFFGTTINPTDLQFDSLRYPASDIRLQIGNNISYRVHTNFLLAAGILYQRNFPFDNRYVNEFRPYQQVMVFHNLSNARIFHRLRFSERFIQNRSDHSYPLTTMLQYMTGFKTGLGRSSVKEKRLYITGYTEEYLTIAGANKYEDFSEFWAYMGLGYDFGRWGKLQNGLVYEWVVRNTKEQVRKLFYVETFWMLNLDLFHKLK